MWKCRAAEMESGLEDAAAERRVASPHRPDYCETLLSETGGRRRDSMRNSGRMPGVQSTIRARRARQRHRTGWARRSCSNWTRDAPACCIERQGSLEVGKEAGVQSMSQCGAHQALCTIASAPRPRPIRISSSLESRRNATQHSALRPRRPVPLFPEAT